MDIERKSYKVHYLRNSRALTLEGLAKNYIYLFFLYITFETLILNFISMIASPLMALVRYGLEGLGYIIALFLVLAFKRLKFSKFDYAVLATIFVGILSSLINFVNPVIFLIGARYLLRYLYIYFIIVYCHWNDEDTGKLYKILRIIMIIQIVLVAFQLVNRNLADSILEPHYGEIINNINSMMTQNKSKLAVYGSLGRYNLFGYFSTLAIWYWIAEINTNKGKKRVLPNIMLIIWLAMLVISYSRQTIVGIIIAYVFYMLIGKKLSVKQLALLIGIGLVVLMLVIGAASFKIADNYTEVGIGITSGTLYDRYVSMFSLKFLKIDYEGYGRTWFMSEGIRRLLAVKPMLGFGLGMYGCPDTLSMTEFLYDELGIPTTYYMDVYVGCLIGQIGLVGFILYMFAYCNILNRCKRVMKNIKGSVQLQKLAIITFGIILSTLVMMFFSSSLCNRIMALYVWMFIGIFKSADGSYLKHNNEGK